MYRAGLLTAVWVPDAAHEALRGMVFHREAAKKDDLELGIGWGSFCCAADVGRRTGSRPGGKRTAGGWME